MFPRSAALRHAPSAGCQAPANPSSQQIHAEAVAIGLTADELALPQSIQGRLEVLWAGTIR